MIFLKRFIAFVLFLTVLAGTLLLWVLPLPGTIPVLMYHFVGSKEDAVASKNYMSREGFARQMQFVRWFGYKPISLQEFYEIKTGKRKPERRQIVITFDDGNQSFATDAYPILKPYEYPVTQFVISESIKQGASGAMSESLIKSLLKENWFTIQSHTLTHPFLSELNEEQMFKELYQSKQDLEKMFKVPIDFVAYPSGDFDERVLKAAEKAGYKLGFTTNYKRHQGKSETLFSLGRVKMSRSAENPVVFLVKLSGLYQLFKKKRGEYLSRQGSDSSPLIDTPQHG